MRFKNFLALTLTFAAVGTACTDTTTQPILEPHGNKVQSNDLLGGLLGGLTSLLIPPLKRTTPLAQDVVWSFTAGPAGATSTNSALGIKIVIPAYALSTTQTITVTALKGYPVAYGFSPHLVFSKKVYLTQNLNGTNAGLLGSLLISGAHFDGDRLDLTSDGLAIVDEVVPAILNLSLLTRSATFGVDHFSGWVVASGKAISSDGGSY